MATRKKTPAKRGKAPGLVLSTNRDKVKHPKSRKKRWTPKERDACVADICERLALEENASLTSLLREEQYPSPTTFYKWLDDDSLEEGRYIELYTRAEQLQAQRLIDDTLPIADDNSLDQKIVVRRGETSLEVDTEIVARSKLRIDARQWLASKLAQRKYGPASRIQLEDQDGKNPFAVFEGAFKNAAAEESK